MRPPPELWVYLAEDDDGEVGPVFAETTGGVRTPLLATTRGGARALRPAAERLGQMMGRPVVLCFYSPTGDVEEVRDAID